MTEIAVRGDIEAQTDEPAIDEELLEEAERGLGTSSRNETINGVLRDYVERKRAERREARENLERLAEEGVFDDDRIAEVDE